MFDADEVQQTIIDPKPPANLLRNICMGLHRRIGQQRFHTAQALGKRDQIQIGRRSVNQSRIHPEGEDSRVAGRLLLSDLVARMIRQCWIVNILHERMFG